MEQAGQREAMILDGRRGMTPEDFRRVVWAGARIEIAPELLAKIANLRIELDRLIGKGVPMYGINTGIGSKKTEIMKNPGDIAEFQRLFIAAHCTGVGAPLSRREARGMLYLRLLSFAQNRSGVRPELMNRLCAMLNHDIIPVIPSQGSVGASGDLAPLSHLAACVMGTLHTKRADGTFESAAYQPKVYFASGEPVDASVAFSACGLPEHFELAAKEALALTNGATMILSQCVVALIELESLLEMTLEAAALSCEALRAEVSAFDARIAYARAHPGAVSAAGRMRELLANSAFCTAEFRRAFAAAVMRLHPERARKKLNPEVPRLQDAYSFRAVPQVLGACADAIAHARCVFTREMASATDNPLIFETGDTASLAPDDDTRTGIGSSALEADGIIVLSGANFHGEPLALVADYLKIAASEIASIAERRIAALLDPAHNYGLPADLAATPHDTGLMILQYTAAALVSENKVLAHPASVDSIPTSSGQEDHVSMGSIGARQLLAIVENVRRVVAIEFICAIAGIRAVRRICDEGGISQPVLGVGTAQAFARWHSLVGDLAPDTILAPIIERVAESLKLGAG
jgi:histidine ammonia-lyase